MSSLPIQPLVSVIVVVYNGVKYIRHCLNAVQQQTYPHIEIIVFDNHSTDATCEIVRQTGLPCKLVENPENIGPWPGFEKALEYAHGKYFVALCVDVILDSEFVAQAVRAAELDDRVGAIEAKIYQFNLEDLLADRPLQREIIDTCGFEIFRNRKVGNIGHGEVDHGQFNAPAEIFAVEGAAPFIRRKAFENLRLDQHIIDPDYFWYGDDLDWAWRMHLFGWRQLFVPEIVAWHDRATTKGSSRNPLDYLRRIKVRRAIPITKRRLGWSNLRFTIIKNDHAINLMRHLPYFCLREFLVLAYALWIEPQVFLEFGRFLKLLPRMLHRRKLVMKRAILDAREMRFWFK